MRAPAALLGSMPEPRTKRRRHSPPPRSPTHPRPSRLPADRPRPISSPASSIRLRPSTSPSPTPAPTSSSTSLCPTTSSPETPSSGRPAGDPRPTRVPAHPRISAALAPLTDRRVPHAAAHVRRFTPTPSSPSAPSYLTSPRQWPFELPIRQAYGLATPGGTVSNIGVAGFTLPRSDRTPEVARRGEQPQLRLV